MRLTLYDLLGRLEGVKGRDGQYKAICPAHSDKTPSLSVSVGNDGEILLKCFAGCSVENIVAALGLEMKDLFAEDKANFPTYEKPKQKPTRTVEAEYPHNGGKTKKIKYRYSDGTKSFAWFHMENGQWQPGRKNFKPELYKSHTPLADTVILVEGEKDVDTLKGMGLVAVSLPDGANSKWDDTYTEELKDRTIIILPDNDEPGRKYAEMCARNLHEVANVFIVDLSKAWAEMPPKADISDMAEAMGADKAYTTMFEVLQSTPQWTPPQEETKKKPGLSYITATDLQKADLPPVQFLVDDILPVGTSLLSAASKIGKSWMVLDMGLAIAAGKPFMGHTTNKAGVLYLALEDSQSRLQDRMNKVLNRGKAPEGMRFSIVAPTLDEGLLEILADDLKANPDTKLIIIDTLQKIRGSSKGRESGYEQDYREMGAVKKFVDERGLSVLFVHHNRKMNDTDDPFNMISGTNGIMGAADTTWTIIKNKRSDGEATLHITGRDVEQTDTVISFDKSAWKWKPMGALDLIVSQRDREAYDNDPIVHTIKTLLKESGEWKGSAADLMAEGKRICKRPIATSAQSIGYSLKKLDDKLMEYDGIIHDRGKNGNAPGKHAFWLNDWTAEADLQDEIPM